MQQHLDYEGAYSHHDVHAMLVDRGERASWEDTLFDSSEEEDHDACSLCADASALGEEYYYDEHPLLEDVMTEGPLQHELVHYLTEVLRWKYHEQVYALHGNLGIYQSQDGQQPSLAPDLCVFRGIAPDSRTFRSWKIGQTGPAPHAVFEIASQGTWKKDVRQKPRLYARMGVKEYFLYDPSHPPVMKGKRRLRGWKLNTPKRRFEALQPDQQGWLWSQQLESYLGADGTLLRLYDNQGQRRLTEAETRKQENHTLTREKRLAEQRAHALEQRAQTLAQEKRMAEQRAQTSEQEKRMAEQRAHTLAEQLRALGINPDDLA